VPHKPIKLTFLAWVKDDVTGILLLGVFFMLSKDGISKKYCATNSGSPEVEQRFPVCGSYCSSIELGCLT
jgi:hypothetical protein